MADLRRLDLNLYDATFGIWQEDANDPSFEREIFGGLIRFMRDDGWTIGPDEDVRRHHRCISRHYRTGIKGPLRAALHVSGRHIEIKLWSTDWPSPNRNGHQYAFGILARMPFLTRMRVRLFARRLEAWLSSRATLNISRREGWEAARSPMERIAAGYAESWHKDKALGRPVCRYTYNSGSADKKAVEHDTTVWFADSRGRICRGRAFYNINNMWWVVAGGELRNLSSGEIHVEMPADLRRRRNERRRRAKLEGLLRGAVSAMDFRRAEALRTILFGSRSVYRIWSTKNDAFYGTGYCGYASDQSQAGCYTFEEAAAEVERVPHILLAIAPDGARLGPTDLAREAARA